MCSVTQDLLTFVYTRKHHAIVSGIATPGHTRACAHVKFAGKLRLNTMCNRKFHVDMKQAYK